MRYRFSLFFCYLLAPTAHAFDTTTASTAKSLYVTGKLISTPFENKLPRDARGDTASFVVSDGSIRDARLEAALRWLRVAHPELAASDQEPAEAIPIQQAITTVPEILHVPQLHMSQPPVRRPAAGALRHGRGSTLGGRDQQYHCPCPRPQHRLHFRCHHFRARYGSGY